RRRAALRHGADRRRARPPDRLQGGRRRVRGPRRTHGDDHARLAGGPLPPAGRRAARGPRRPRARGGERGCEDSRMSSARLSVVEGRPRRRIPPLRSGVYLLPNLVTTLGLFAGFYSIIATLNHQYRIAAILILLAQVCDMLDGRIARLTATASSFGVQYDSLADLIAFGVAPGFLVYTWALRPWGRWGWLAATLYVTCGALRLARFNVQIGTVEKKHFVGLPIPAAADVVATTVILYYYLGYQGDTSKHLTML